MKLEVEMYVRYYYSNYTKIDKIIVVKEDIRYGKYKISNGNYVSEKKIIKASHNIIDLLEVGDYVNGSKVVNIYKEDSVVIEKKEEITEPDGYVWSDCIEVNVKEIKTVVTKEQFASMEYKL